MPTGTPFCNLSGTDGLLSGTDRFLFDLGGDGLLFDIDRLQTNSERHREQNDIKSDNSNQHR